MFKTVAEIRDYAVWEMVKGMWSKAQWVLPGVVAGLISKARIGTFDYYVCAGVVMATILLRYTLPRAVWQPPRHPPRMLTMVDRLLDDPVFIQPFQAHY